MGGERERQRERDSEIEKWETERERERKKNFSGKMIEKGEVKKVRENTPRM